MSRPAKILIDLAAIQANCEWVENLAPQSKIVAVIKANAYGHNALKVAKALGPQVHMLTVSCLEEALQLRKNGISQAILLLEGCFEACELTVADKHRLDLVVHTEQQVQDLLRVNLIKPLNIWLKIDTGMHRLGITANKAAEMYYQLISSTNVGKITLMSHFAHADAIDDPFTQQQVANFEQQLEAINTLDAGDFTISLANSAAILAWPQTHKDWVRPGIMLYGLSPFSQSVGSAKKLIPAMNFESQVIALRTIQAGEFVGYGCTWQAKRESIIATVAVGYGDGYPRNAKSGTPVWLNGQIAPLVGRVSMDLISLDVTDLSPVAIGDRVVLWGKELNANEVAKWADTIGYELVTRMPNRVTRYYLD